jgi:GNAT superfamily N-acetyltransferase
VTKADKPLGWVNRYGEESFPDTWMVGIDICEDAYLNRGLGTEALGLWVGYLFSNSQVHRIGLDTWSFNRRMMRVADKLGFAYEGAEREVIHWQGEWLDAVHYGMLRSEWEQSPIHNVEYVYADVEMKAELAVRWGDVVGRHMHTEDGFSIVSLYGGKPVGLISVYWRDLPPPLSGAREGYIDIIQVSEGCRRRGIAAELVRRSAARARREGAYQLRAWSSEDKVEAIPMWVALGFGLCPAVDGGIRGYFVTKPL